jgi:putative salt-induced outer membrane protein YdiY
MNSRIAIVLFTLLPSWTLLARPSTDVIVMKNGDRLTCEIKKLDRGVLYVSLDYVDGTVSIAWSKVMRLESTQLFVVVTESGNTYTGTLMMSPGPGDQPRGIEIVEDKSASESVVEQSEVVGAQQYGESIWSRLKGNFSAGYMYTKGNSTSQYNLSSNLTYQRERSALQLDYSSAFSTAAGANETIRNQVDINGQRLLPWNNWYYSGSALFLQSSAENISFQSVWGAGIGRYLKNTASTQLKITGGLAYQQIQYSSGGNDNALVALIAGELDIFRFKKTELTVTQVVFPSITESGRVHFNLNSMYKIQIVKNLWWNISLYGNWDSRPPKEFVGSDYGTSVGLTYSFH